MKVMFNKAGGNASKAALTSRISLPRAWMDILSISPGDRDVVLTLDAENNTITIKKPERNCPG